MPKNWQSNKSVSRVDQRLAAALHLRQVESLIEADRISNKVGSVFDKASRELLAIVADGISANAKLDGFNATLLKSLAESKELTLKQFEKLALWSHRESARAFVRSIPWSWLQSRIKPEEAEAYEAMHHPAPPMFLNFDAGMLSFGIHPITEDENGPYTLATPVDLLRKQKLTDKEKEELAEKLLFPPPEPRRIAEILTRGNWIERLESLSSLITNRRSLLSEFISGFADGENISQLRKRIEPLVGGIKSSAQRIARTEAMRVTENMQREAWQPLGDLMVGVQLLAVLDERTRPEHATRNGTIFYKSPTGNQRPISDLPNLPDAPNCRCWTSPVLEPPEELKSNKQLREALGNSQPAGIPDPTTYDQWFSKADPGRRKIVVGVGRYASLQKRLRSEGVDRDLEWSDFIDSEGRLLSTNYLLNESPLEREARKKIVATSIELRREMIRQVSAVGFSTV